MNRWTLAALAALALTPPAFAQTVVREAPKDVKPALMAVGNPPEIALNGQADRLSPGARIRDTRNMMVLSASLSGQTVPVVFRRDAAGLVHEVWLLTAEEYRKVGGVNVGTPDGYLKFMQLLQLVFGAR